MKYSFFITLSCILLCRPSSGEQSSIYYRPYVNSYDKELDDSQCEQIDGKFNRDGSLSYRINQTDVNVCWIISMTPSQFITIRLPYINIAPHSYIYDRRSSCDNYLKVGPRLSDEDSRYLSDGQSIYPKKFCGTSNPGLATYFIDHLRIDLFTRAYPYGLKESGFSLNYTITDGRENILIDEFEFVSLDIYPRQYMADYLTCTWSASLMRNVPIEVSLNSLHMRDTSSFMIYDGADYQRPLLKSWSNKNYELSKDVVGTSHSIFLQFSFYSSGQAFNITIKEQGYCMPGTYICGDGEHCYKEEQHCDGIRNCLTGYDEMGCFGCNSNEFWCGGLDKSDCYTKEQYCNVNQDCRQHIGDESDCTSCDGAFLCKATKSCIYESWRCDGQSDCIDAEDEEGCTYPASRRVITAAIVGSLICGLLLAIALGCSCKLYKLRTAAHSRNRRNRPLLPTPLGRIARELLQREAPPSYNMAIDGVEQSESSSRSRSSSSSRRRRERRRRRRNREPAIRRAQPSQPTAEPSNDVNQIDSVDGENVPSSRHDSTTTTMTSIQSSTPSSRANSVHASSNNNDDDIVQILHEIGLSEYSNESPDQTQDTSNTPSTSTAGTSTMPEVAGEQQAEPLPKKKRIRPVMVEAPCNNVVVDDIPGCVYPNPPTYSEAILSRGTEPVTLQIQQSQDENFTNVKADSHSSKHVLNRLWAKHSPKKSRDFWKLPSSIQNIFSLSSTSLPFHELQESADVQPDDDQAQLIRDFVADESSTEEYSSNSISTDQSIIQDSLNSDANQSLSQDDESLLNMDAPLPQFSSNDHVELVDVSANVGGFKSHHNPARRSCKPTTSSTVGDDTAINQPPGSSQNKPIEITMPEIRVETQNNVFTLDISGSLSERT